MLSMTKPSGRGSHKHLPLGWQNLRAFPQQSGGQCWFVCYAILPLFFSAASFLCLQITLFISLTFLFPNLLSFPVVNFKCLCSPRCCTSPISPIVCYQIKMKSPEGIKSSAKSRRGKIKKLHFRLGWFPNQPTRDYEIPGGIVASWPLTPRIAVRDRPSSSTGKVAVWGTHFQRPQSHIL